MERVGKLEVSNMSFMEITDAERDEQHHNIQRDKALAQKAIESAGESPRYIGNLTSDDVAALRRTTLDISDIDPRTLERAQASISQAYEVARLVSLGAIDPLSAGYTLD